MINLENLLDGSIADRNFQALARLVLDTGGRSIGIRFGAATITWPGGSPFATVAVTHGLSRTPVVVFAGDAGGGTMATNIPVWSASAPGATTFTAAAETSDASAPAVGLTRTFYWVCL